MNTRTHAAGQSPRLPTPEERPNADVVIYDGHCNFCIGRVTQLAAWDSRGRLAFLSLHDPDVRRRFPDLTQQQLMEQMVVVNQDGRRYGGMEAVRYLTRRLPRLWLAVPLLHIPGSLSVWRFLYRQAANRRYQIAGTADCADEECRLPAD